MIRCYYFTITTRAGKVYPGNSSILDGTMDDAAESLRRHWNMAVGEDTPNAVERLDFEREADTDDTLSHAFFPIGPSTV